MILAASALHGDATAVNARYLAAVHQARLICEAAMPHDRAAAHDAAGALAHGAGNSQPEVLADLQANPPDLVDAAARLRGIEEELGRPVAVTDGHADAKLRAILAEARYQPAGVSPLDRLWGWLLMQLLRLLGWLLTGGGGGIGAVIELAAAAAAGILLAVVLARSVWSRRGGEVVAGPERAQPRPAHDWFAEADRRAGAGDYPGALRALTSAVATALGGEGAWEKSPLTVRELFVGTARIEPLRPLLLPFEASAYGHRQPDAQVYSRAAEVAAPYRTGAPQ